MTIKGVRHGSNCGCCKCKNPPPNCSLVGSVSGGDVTLTWSYSGVGVNNVSIYRCRHIRNSTDCEGERELVYHDDGTSTTRTVTITDGVCAIYFLYVCNPCGCCYSSWNDNRVGVCQCYNCTYSSGMNTLSRRYSGIPNIQCGCQRGEVLSMVTTVRDLLPLYSSDVEYTVHNPANSPFCKCWCGTSGSIFIGSYPHGAKYRRCDWAKVSNASTLNGSYVFTSHRFDNGGGDCGYYVDPWYYHAGEITLEYQSCSTPDYYISQQICEPRPAECPDIRNTITTATVVFDAFVVGGPDPAGTQPDGSPAPWLALTTGPPVRGDMRDRPKVYTKVKSIAGTSPTGLAIGDAFFHDSNPCANHGSPNNPCTGTTGGPNNYFEPSSDGCGWLTKQSMRIVNTTSCTNGAECCQVRYYIDPPRLTNLKVLNGPTYSGELLFYSNAENVFTTEF